MHVKARCVGVLTAGLLALSVNAQAGYLYTFGSSNFGSFAFTIDNIIQRNSNFTAEIANSFTIGSPSASLFIAFTQDVNFAFQDVKTSNGSEETWQMVFSVLPTAVGTYVPTQAILGSSNLQNSTLVIADVPDTVRVPEPSALALIGATVTGLLLCRRRRVS